MTPIPRIQHMSCLDFFMELYFMEYINDVLIPETNKCLNSAMKLSEYFCVIGCIFILACYVGHSVRDFSLKDPINRQKGASIRLNHIIPGRFLEKITHVMSYIILAITEFNDPFFQQIQMQQGCNKNTVANFYPSWVSVLCDSIQEWINRYTCPERMFVSRKPHPFGKDYHTIMCAKYKVIF